jgi:hemerythrin-like domain-containing protein
MPGQSPAGPLMHEHRIIERMLAVMSSRLASARTAGGIDPGFVDTATDFIRTYADRCHHGKEEDILFLRLADKDLEPALAKEMAELIEEHVYARGVTRGLVEANGRYAGGDEAALAEIESAMQTLVEFYPVHIEKEDRHFFKPAMAYFTDAERAQMLQDFYDFDRALIHEKYLGVVESLERGAA